ncbi:hypothetical protein ACFLYR_06280 [Chloroflexota bacterium]
MAMDVYWYILLGVCTTILVGLVIYYKELLFKSIPSAVSEARRVIYPTVLSGALFFIALAVAVLTIDISANTSECIRILAILFALMGIGGFVYLWWLGAMYYQRSKKEQLQPRIPPISIQLNLTPDQVQVIVEAIKIAVEANNADEHDKSSPTKCK